MLRLPTVLVPPSKNKHPYALFWENTALSILAFLPTVRERTSDRGVEDSQQYKEGGGDLSGYL